ncbi:ENT-COPALYL DIPHOSPHATE SYNTHASE CHLOROPLASTIC [Salix purpurea]|uniref:ENT-COPALYL DIPHOSPHATE SYNTHASE CHLOROPLASTIC n=1 Tax=Salix purpurea TaxID=77065 RepID=A0A9Q0WH72_SALPP|nr:ENT-COPALYL DIPHOSPHATE SYNTHASE CHLOROPLASTIC [Salix purpurea]
MEFSKSFSIQALVKTIKGELLLDSTDPYSFIAPSAYDTAWLAMVPDGSRPCQPMFKNCLDWVLNNQNEEGFWGEYDGHGMPTVECLPATIACMVALKRWKTGEMMVDKGMAFIEANAEKLIGEIYGSNCPRWFAIVFPAMVEMAQISGLEIISPERKKRVVMDIFDKRERILEREELVDKNHYPPLLSYLEALPALCNFDQEAVHKHLHADGSLFQSPSATARAFMATGNKDCLNYLRALAQRSTNGVPQTYPMDEELLRLCMVNQLQKLGLAEHFEQEIEGLLEQVYRNYVNQDQSRPNLKNSIAAQLYKDSLAFCLLRMHGFSVSPWMFCWFLREEEVQDQIERNHEYFSSVILNVYRATDLMFPGDHVLEEARSFSRKLLEKTISTANKDQHIVPFPSFQSVIKHELRFPWMARLDHLEHRMWMEEKNNSGLWMGKTCFHRLSCLQNDKLKQLAAQNYEVRQTIYRSELEELTRWSKSWGLSDMGFGREKTAYCYFAVAASTPVPHDYEIRMMVAKSAIVITVADDFYDMEGSLDDLEKITDAVQRWDAKGLSGHSKTIFDALDSLVNELARKYFRKHGTDITNSLRDIWSETFASWFTEAKWSKTGFIPAAEEYLETGMVSIASHTLVLPASCFLNPSIPIYKLNPAQYESITELLMVIPRLLNDIQSYKKEQKEGKTNFVLLHLKENPEADIEDSIAYTREILEKKKKELLEHALMDGFNDFSKPCRHLHLSCVKVFQMFFDSSNRYDSNTEMFHDIQKAFYIPVEIGAPKPLPLHSGSKKRYPTVAANYHFDQRCKNRNIRLAANSLVPQPLSGHPYMKMPMAPKFKLCFM